MTAVSNTLFTLPDTRLLSNGRYRVVVSVAGAGRSELGEYALTRYTADPTRDAEGWFFYLRDLDSNQVWSAGHQPVQRAPARYQARLGESLVTIEREDEQIESRMEIGVDPVQDIEWRKITLTNLGASSRRLEVTSYIEVALNAPAADARHPAFSKLFLQTEFRPELGSLMACRRPRSPEEPALALGHAMIAGGDGGPPLEFETDRARFIGRGRTLAAPRALDPSIHLSQTVGSVLDPILSLRRTVELAPGASAQINAVLAAGMDRRQVERALTSALAQGSLRPGNAEPPGSSTASELPASAASPYQPASGVGPPAPVTEALQFANGFGGFSESGDEYVIRINRTTAGVRLPPQPWTNVVASPKAGFVASERGLGFTWIENSRENRLTPWFNDPVSDPAGEALYLRDEDAQVFWSPTPGPVPGAGAYEVRHGFGSTIWRHESQELTQEVLAFVPQEDPLKIVRLRVRNTAQVARRISAFFFAEWILGEFRFQPASGIVTEATADGHMILATSLASGATGHPVAFAAAIVPAGQSPSLTADRASFLGRWGSTERPEALRNARALNGRTGAGLDPCAGLQIMVHIPPGETREWTFLLGQVEDRQSALRLRERYREPEAVERAFQSAAGFWRRTLSAVRIETPSAALDLMVNGWLAYQNLSCRLWARSAFYQSGGAFGFRDQLQDAAALVLLLPSLTREQILFHAAHQFVEGDVLHWWHPPDSRGLRTRCSDDLLWLPYVTQLYLDATGDATLLEEPALFLTARALEAGEDEVFLTPTDSGTRATLYEHCCRALDRSLTRGAHGLPLIGSGDWNDGMNRVGRLGRGESVWLGLFLHTILERFIPHCDARRDSARALRYRQYLASLAAALQDAGWDGAWYRRAYYDDGTPLGSAQSDECRVDALAQAWAVMSGVAPPERAESSLDAVERYLVDQAAGLIRLLTPPFDKTAHDPGYIKGYLPGVRENGGQYTHAALWVVRAMAEAGRSERAAALLELLNPIRHGASPEAIATYQVEPYVIAADVYGVEPHIGRGGWTWYTGSAGWMFRVALESILGVTVRAGSTLVIRPCIPASWSGFRVHYRLPDGRTRCDIVVRRGGEHTRVEAGSLAARVVDEAVLVTLPADGASHRIEVVLPDYSPAPGRLER